jgi:carboxylesterase type B
MTTVTSFLGKPFLLGRLCAWGQATNSVDVRGSMTDPLGAVAPGATVTITGLGKNTKRTFITADSGFYDTGPLVPTDHYLLIFKKRGLRHRRARAFDAQRRRNWNELAVERGAIYNMSENRIRLNRRQALLLPASAGVGAAFSTPAKASDSTKIGAQQDPCGCSTPRSAVAKTQYGKVRGFLDGGVLTFKGIPYGQNTVGENRWLPAKAAKPWDGEYPALVYGANCPQRLRQFMKELKLQPNDLAALQKIDGATLNAAGNAAIAKLSPMGPVTAGLGGPPSPTPRVGWSPAVDAKIVTLRAFYDVAPEVSKNVPMMIDSVSEEGNSMRSRPTKAQWHATLARAWGEAKATALIAAMKKAHPDKSIRTLSYGVNGLTARSNVQRIVKLKFEPKGTPVYQYYFTWQSPKLENAGAWHTAELAFCFDNTKRCEQGTGNTPEAQALAKKMATAWVNFARTGNPSQPGLDWTTIDSTRCQTMFDNSCRMVDGPDGELQRIC